MGSDRRTPRRSALLIATSTYDDPDLARLVSPAKDCEALAQVLAVPEIGDFEVSEIQNATSSEICQAIDDFTADRERQDLVLIYLSCHGLKDDQGRLYFAARNTRRDRLRSTAVPAGFVNDTLFACLSRRKVLLLDCCYSGAFAKGLAVKADASVHTADHFDARGLVVLTASDSTQYAFEGNTLTGNATPSLFTASLTDGLRTGAADLDHDGLISVDDVYEFTRRRLSEQPRPQSPRKWAFDVAGSIVLARSAAATVIGPAGAEPEDGVPRVLQTVLADAPSSPTPTRMRAQQGVWFLAALLLLLASVGSCVLLAYLIDTQLHPLVDWEHMASRQTQLRAAGLAGATWALAYAALDLQRGGVAHWYDLLVRWFTSLARVVRPLGVTDFFGTALAAIPLNVEVAVLVSVAAGAAGYEVNGSQGRDIAFRLTFIMITTVAVLVFLTGGARRQTERSGVA